MFVCIDLCVHVHVCELYMCVLVCVFLCVHCVYVYV